MEKGYKTTNLISQTIIHKYDFSNVWCEILIKHTLSCRESIGAVSTLKL